MRTLFRHILRLALIIGIFLGMATGAQAAVTITRTSSPVFYADIGNGLTDMYVAYRITTTTAITDAWAEIGSFSGLNISLSSNEDGLYHIGQMAAGSSKMVYFYLHTAANFTGSENHAVSVYNGKPPSGTYLGAQTFSLTESDTIQASASKVNSVITGPNPATLGGIITMTVTGDTGTTNGPLAFTPASDSIWMADTYELYSCTVNMPNGTVFYDQPYLATYSGTSGTFVVTYQFIAKGSAAAPSAGSPANYIQSGTQLKHAPTGASAGSAPPPTIDPTTGNAITLSKFANTSLLTPGVGGTATYTVRITNNGTIDVTLDDIVDTLPSSPASASYVSGSSRFNGVAIANPIISGSQLTWSGALVIPALSSRDLTFQATIPGTAGTYVNSAIGHIGTTIIDTTVDTTDNVPATWSINVSTAATLTKAFSPTVIGTDQQSALTFTITNGQGYPAQSGLSFIDTMPANLTVTGVSANTCNGSVSWGSNSITLSNGAMTSGTAGCTITATVSSSVAGTYLNKYDSNTSLSNISGLGGGLDASALSATLQVSSATLTKAFTPTNINANQDADVAFTITNGTGNPAQSNIGFTETLPSGLTVATPVLITSTCGGTVYKPGTSTPLSGGETGFTFSGGSFTSGTASCTVTVAVVPPSSAPAGTVYTNSNTNVTNLTPPGLVNDITSQTLTIVSTPTLEKGFSPTTVGVSQPSTLTFTINNPSRTKQQGLAFTDLFPAGLVVATPPSVTTTCGGSVYRTGTTTPLTGGETALDFSGGSLAANTASCTVTVKVTSPTAGAYTNSSTNITSLTGLVSSVSPRTLTVAGTTLTKAFGASSIITGSTTPLVFTVTNGSGDPAQSGFGFTDQLPAGLTVSGTPTSPQCGGTVSYSSASNTLTFSGGTLSLGTHSCSISTNVTSSTPGTYVNDSANILTSSGGLNTSGVTATLVVGTAPTITVTKALVSPGRADASDQFTVQIRNSSGTVVGSTAASTSSGSGATVTAGSGTSSYTASSLGGSYSLNEVMAAGSSSLLSRYLISVSCSNNGSAVATPTTLGQSFTPIAGDNYVCTISNTPAPTIRVTKALTAAGRIDNNDQFTVQIKDNTGSIIGSTASSTTAGSGATVTSGTGTSSYTASSLGGVYSLNEVMSAGSSTPLSQYVSTLTCSKNGLSVVIPASLGQTFTPAAGDNYDCIITNARPGVDVTGTVYSDANHNAALDGGETGTGQSLYVKLTPRSGSTCAATATAAAAADSSTGIYQLTSVQAGDYCLLLDDNATLSDTTPAYPAGWLGTEHPSGVISITVGSSALAGQNFGLYHGSTVTGRVFSDIGAGTGGIANNGLQDGTETGVAGVSVALRDANSGTTLDSAATDATGDYTLWLQASAVGSVRIAETNPASWLSTGGSAGTTGGSYDRGTDSTTFIAAAGMAYSGVTFADVPPNSFTDNNSGTLVAGGTMYYRHTFTAGSGGTVTFGSSAFSTPALSGWSELIHQDSNCNGTLDSGEPQISAPITVTAGQQVCILLQETSPTAATAGNNNSVTVSAIFDYINAVPALTDTSHTLTDLSTILQSGLTLIKYVDKASAKPGEVLTYTVTYANTGFSTLTNIVISDPVPTYTTLTVPAASAACCVGPSGDCLGTAAAPFPNAITSCTPATTSSSVTWTLGGTLSPGESGQVKFSVIIDQ